VTFLTARDGGDPDRGTTLQALAAAGGGTEAFSVGMSFTGFFVFVLMTANWAGEFSLGTFRTLLMKQPARPQVLIGKLGGLLAFAAIALVVAEVLSVALSFPFAATQDVSTSHWISIDALGDAGSDYLNAMIGVTAWTVFAMMLGLLLRSTPLALGVGIGWAGPFEHLTGEAINAAGYYPGLLLEALSVGGTDEVSYTRAVVMVLGYAAIAAVIAVYTFTRRDMAH
jgi:ABC-type transport system involved in multi-copper enzyme maturation permease subunit